MHIKSRIVLKIYQLICSTFVVYCLYNAGPNWMLALSFLLVPPFGIYLILRSSNRKNRCDTLHSRAVEKSWLRVEITICFTMTVVFFGFGILILYAFFKLMDNVYFLLAGLGSILVSLLYMISGLITVGLLRQGVTDIIVDESIPRQLSYSANDDPNHFSMSVISEYCGKTIERNQELKGQSTTIKNTSGTPMKKHQHAPALFVEQRSEMDQHIIDYIREELDRHLDDEAQIHDNSTTNHCTDHCKSSDNSDAIGDVVKIDSREQYQYASRRNSAIVKSGLQCNQELQHRSATIWNQISGRKATPIPLFVPAKVGDVDDNHLVEHFNDHFSTFQKHDPMFVHRISNSVKSDTAAVHVTSPVELYNTQQLHLFNKTAAKCDKKHHSKGEDDSFKHSDSEKFSDDDSTSGISSFVWEDTLEGKSENKKIANSMPVELKSLDLAVQPQLLAVEVPVQSIRGYSRNGSDNSSLQQMSVIASRIHNRRESSRGSQKRCYLKHDSHRGLGDTQHPSYVTLTDSNYKGPQSSISYKSAIRGRQKVSNLSREQESIYPSCMSSIVTAIDSGRESDIIRKNSLRRTSSRDKKIRNKGFDVVIRAQNDGERSEDRRITLGASSFSYDKPTEAYLVTEF